MRSGPISTEQMETHRHDTSSIRLLGEHGVVGQRRDPPDPIEAEGAEHEPAELGARDPLPRRLREKTHEHAGREGQGEGELELNRRRHCHP